MGGFKNTHKKEGENTPDYRLYKEDDSFNNREGTPVEAAVQGQSVVKEQTEPTVPVGGVAEDIPF